MRPPISIGHVLRSLLRGTQGVVGLEFGLLAPMLILAFAGALEFAFMYKQYEMGSAGARDAARYLARVADPGSAASQTAAQNLVLYGTIDTSGPSRISDWVDNPGLLNVSVSIATFDNSGGTFRGPDGGTANIDVVYVIVDIVYPGLLLGLVGFDQAIVFTVTHSERHIGG